MRKNLQLKIKITELVLKQLPENLNYTLSGRLTYQDYLSRWWFTGRGEGFRLTEQGDTAFRLAQIEFYEHKMDDLLSKSGYGYYKILLELNKKLSCPYFVVSGKNPTIRLYDSKIAMMISLYGNLMDYLNSINIK